jgi:methyl-accepting chemotaxis protein
MRLTKINFDKRILGIFGVVLVVVLVLAVLAVGGIGLRSLKTMNDKINQIVVINNGKMDNASAMSTSVTLSEASILNLLLANNAAEQQEAIDKLKWNASKYDDAKSSVMELLAAAPQTTLEEEILPKIDASKSDASALLSQTVSLVKAEKMEEAQQLWKEKTKPAMVKWDETIRELVSIERNLNDTASVETQDMYVLNRNIILVTSSVSLLLMAAIVWLLVGSFVRPLKVAISFAEGVARGDLTNEIDRSTLKGDLKPLMEALILMSDGLASVVTEVRGCADQVAQAAEEIATGNLDLSARTEEQASSLEETASSMEELTSTMKQSEQNTRQANTLAMTASNVAEKGGAVVGNVIETMDSINQSAKKIVEIIGVIDGIAFQTNILALNAAVEAARAGEQGRGFAVVATEVRNLAQRSASAAKEIKSLIGDSVEKVDAGTKLVDQAGSTMNEVVSSVKRVTDIFGEILSASQEQGVGVNQINEAIGQMDQTTQQNASMVEEAAAAATSLKDQTANLVRAVSIFKLKQVQTALLN